MSFAQFLLRSGVLQFGQFRLKSGAHSPYFMNFGEVSSGAELRELGGFLAGLIRARAPGANVVLGPPYKAISMAVATVIELDGLGQACSFLTFRKEEKGHGEGGMFLGHHLGDADRIVLVDDVMTSGQTKLEALEMIRSEARRLGLKPPRFEAVVVGVDRQEAEGAVTAAQAFTAETGLPVFSVATIRELADELEGEISPDHHRALREYLER